MPVIIGGLFSMGRINPWTASSYASCVFISMLEYLQKGKKGAVQTLSTSQWDSKYLCANKAKLQFLFLKRCMC